jgi:hypothetical protein
MGLPVPKTGKFSSWTYEGDIVAAQEWLPFAVGVLNGCGKRAVATSTVTPKEGVMIRVDAITGRIHIVAGGTNVYITATKYSTPYNRDVYEKGYGKPPTLHTNFEANMYYWYGPGKRNGPKTGGSVSWRNKTFFIGNKQGSNSLNIMCAARTPAYGLLLVYNQSLPIGGIRTRVSKYTVQLSGGAVAKAPVNTITLPTISGYTCSQARFLATSTFLYTVWRDTTALNKKLYLFKFNSDFTAIIEQILVMNSQPTEATITRAGTDDNPPVTAPTHVRTSALTTGITTPDTNSLCFHKLWVENDSAYLSVHRATSRTYTASDQTILTTTWHQPEGTYWVQDEAPKVEEVTYSESGTKASSYEIYRLIYSAGAVSQQLVTSLGNTWSRTQSGSATISDAVVDPFFNTVQRTPSGGANYTESSTAKIPLYVGQEGEIVIYEKHTTAVTHSYTPGPPHVINSGNMALITSGTSYFSGATDFDAKLIAWTTAGETEITSHQSHADTYALTETRIINELPRRHIPSTSMYPALWPNIYNAVPYTSYTHAPPPYAAVIDANTSETYLYDEGLGDSYNGGLGELAFPTVNDYSYAEDQAQLLFCGSVYTPELTESKGSIFVNSNFSAGMQYQITTTRLDQKNPLSADPPYGDVGLSVTQTKFK